MEQRGGGGMVLFFLCFSGWQSCDFFLWVFLHLFLFFFCFLGWEGTQPLVFGFGRRMSLAKCGEGVRVMTVGDSRRRVRKEIVFAASVLLIFHN